MKASALISLLNDMVEKHGDILVGYEFKDSVANWLSPIQDIEHKTYFNGNTEHWLIFK